MRIKRNYIAPLLTAGIAAAAIAGAPTATAATGTNPDAAQQNCIGAVCPDTHSTLIGPLPGNNQINDSPGPVSFAPQYPYAEGSYFGGGHGGFGGGHGGGGGHGK